MIHIKSTEGMFAGSYESFISQQPARHTIEALEDCEVLSIQYENWQQLLLTLLRMNEFVRKILEPFHDLYETIFQKYPAPGLPQRQRLPPL